MYAVVRTYSGTGAKELFDLLEANKADVERVMSAVPGFVSYALIRTDDGGMSVTICQDKAGTGESIEAARHWIREHAPHLGVGPPAITHGEVILHLT